ncbi:helix-turn-helix domain-containing protein [Leptospira wolffii]|nr:helix-turn-helix domain-containing protein [Leptospira wolffii]
MDLRMVPTIPIVSLTICVFSSFLILTKRPRYAFDSIYAIFTICLALPHLGHILARRAEWGHDFLEFSILFPYTFGPLLYLYIRNLTGNSDKIRLVDLLHFLPFLTLMLFFLIGFFGREEEWNGDPEWRRPEMGFHRFGFLLSVSMLFYLIWIFLLLRKHRRSIEDHFSNIDNLKDLSWMYWVLVLFGISTGVHLFLDAIRFGEMGPGDWDPRIVRGSAILVFTAFFCWFGVRQTVVFTSRELEHWKGRTFTPAEVFPEEERKKYEKSGLREEKIPEYLDKIRDYMNSKMPYKDSEFSIDSLSQGTDVPRFYITQILNEHLGTNFYNFTNEYRIREILKEFDAKPPEKPNILSLSLEYGFNSKSTFNSAFKKFTGKTPSEYLEKKSKIA